MQNQDIQIVPGKKAKTISGNFSKEEKMIRYKNIDAD
jgi:hypothetical protein